jgi:hypothetical protein
MLRLSPVDNANSYETQWTTDGGKTWVSGGISSKALRIVLTDLTPGTVYTILARALGGSTGQSILEHARLHHGHVTGRVGALRRLWWPSARTIAARCPCHKQKRRNENLVPALFVNLRRATKKRAGLASHPRVFTRESFHFPDLLPSVFLVAMILVAMIRAVRLPISRIPVNHLGVVSFRGVMEIHVHRR